MQIDAIYDNGIIKPLVPLKLKKKEVRMKIIIPDELIEMGQVSSRKNTMRERIDAILGQYAHPRPSVTSGADRSVWHGHLEEKYGS